MGETKYIGKPQERFSVTNELNHEYGAKMSSAPVPRAHEPVQIPPHLDVSTKPKNTLEPVVQTMKHLIDSEIERIVNEGELPRDNATPLSLTSTRDKQFLGLYDMEAEVSKSNYQGPASEGDIDTLQLRAEDEPYTSSLIESEDEEE
jgi:hypothetical protein